MTGAPLDLLWGPDIRIIRDVHWAGTVFDAVVRPDHWEIRRRRRVGLAPVLDFTLLRALALLPYGHAVPWRDLDPVCAAILDCAPPGTVTCSVEAVRNDVRPALDLVCVFRVAASWRAMRRLAVMSPAAPTGVIATQKPRVPEDAMRTASRHGLGFGLLKKDGSASWVTPPAMTARPGIARTRLLEILLHAWDPHATGTPITSHHARS